MVCGIHTVLCPVSDMSRSQAFYEQVLGLKAGVRSPYWTDFSLGGQKIGLHPPFGESFEPPRGGWILGIEVENLPALKAHLESYGVNAKPYHQTPSGVIMDFADPDGNSIQAIQIGSKIEDFG